MEMKSFMEVLLSEIPFHPPQSGDAPIEVKSILKKVYTSGRAEDTKKNKDNLENKTNKEKWAKIAWTAVRNAGWKKTKSGWVKS